MRHLLACTAIAPVLAALTVADAAAETTISSATTTALKTSTVASGAADNLTIASGGSITLTSGTAVTIDSNNTVSNAGTITINDADNVTGILAAASTTGDISVSGTISLTEDYTGEDEDDDDDVDGPFAEGSGKNGILVQSGAAHVGDIDLSGTITIEGNDSAGIRLNGPLTGNLTTSGTISVLGDNSYGIVANDITGDVTLQGTISAKGENSVGVALLGDVDGAVKIQGTITSTGYRTTTRPTDTSDLDEDDLLQGGSAVVIAGNVSGGVIFDVPPTLDDDDDDVDNDGLTDEDEGSAVVVTYGSAAAVQIGSADSATTIGSVATETSGYGLVVNGSIYGYGIYDGVDANALVVGGLGGDVSIANGISIAGTVSAVSYDSNATALRIGSGATTGTIDVSGSIGASGATLEGTTATGIQIDAGASVDAITVSGRIVAIAGSDEDGTAVGIRDASGTVTSLTNTGAISASGGVSNIAIDLSANTSGVTLTQALEDEDASDPSIAGDILLGSGSDIVTVSAGTITGDIDLGNGNNSLTLSGSSSITGDVTFGSGNDSLTLGDTASIVGDVDFGGGTDSLTLNGTSSISGAISNSSGTSVVLNGGTLNATNTGTVSLASLSASATSTLGVTIDGEAGTNTVYDVSGAASFATGSQVKVNLTQVSGSEGDYVIVTAGSLSGSLALDDETLLPYMFKGSLASDTTAGTVTLSIAAKTVSELGLVGSQARAYSAIFNALDNDSDIANAFLGITDGTTLKGNLQQMLPDHAGGTFEAATQGSRAMARILSDPNGIYRTKDGKLGFWLQQVAFNSSKDVGTTADYDIDGWGAGGGAEYLTDYGAFGGSLSYVHATNASGANNNVASDQYELAAHWRGQWGALQTYARVSAAKVNFAGSRYYENGDVTRTAYGKWDGTLVSATAGASYQMQFDRFSLRPAVSVDYYRLKEDGYSETGGGDAFNLTVLGRTSDETAATGTLTAGYEFGSLNKEDGWLRLELEGGRRQIVGGSLGNTTANFNDGEQFTLVAEDRTNGWTGRARLYGGTDTFRIGGEVGAEQQQNNVALSVRATVNFVL